MPGRFKICSKCLRSFTREQWDALPSKGVTMGMDWRDCNSPGCGNTLVVVVDREAFEGVGEVAR